MKTLLVLVLLFLAAPAWAVTLEIQDFAGSPLAVVTSGIDNPVVLIGPATVDFTGTTEADALFPLIVGTTSYELLDADGVSDAFTFTISPIVSGSYPLHLFFTDNPAGHIPGATQIMEFEGLTSLISFCDSAACALSRIKIRSEDDTGSHLPEPSTWLLLGTGFLGLIYFRKRFAAF